jgi:hypothetical protein
MLYLCECRGPCRRTFDLTLDTYAWLRTMGTVVSPECAEREDREVVARYNARVVVVHSNGARCRPAPSL